LHAVAFVRDIRMHIYVVMSLLMFSFWIKLTMKMPNYLTLGPPVSEADNEGEEVTMPTPAKAHAAHPNPCREGELPGRDG